MKPAPSITANAFGKSQSLAPDLVAHIFVRRGAVRVGGERLALLTAIDTQGSIAGAARARKLSYKGAWDAVQALNTVFDVPLVEQWSGGPGGGGAALTEKGRQVALAFSKWEISVTISLQTLIDELHKAGPEPTL